MQTQTLPIDPKLLQSDRYSFRPPTLTSTKLQAVSASAKNTKTTTKRRQPSAARKAAQLEAGQNYRWRYEVERLPEPFCLISGKARR